MGARRMLTDCLEFEITPLGLLETRDCNGAGLLPRGELRTRDDVLRDLRFGDRECSESPKSGFPPHLPH